MKSILNALFRALFSFQSFHKYFFGVHQKILGPLQLLKGQIKTIELEDGIRLQLHLDDWIQENLYFLNTYEPAETAFIQSVLKEGDRFIDIGANIGFHSFIAAKAIHPSGQVISFEPFEMNYQLFLRNVSLNAFEQIVVEQLAISNSNGTTPLYYDELNNNLGMVSTVPTQNSTPTTSIESIRLDDYLSDKNIDQVDFIKLDIEGGEYPALLGMEQTLLAFKPILMVEIDEDILLKSKYTSNQIEEFLDRLGYCPNYFDSAGELTESKNECVSKNVIFKPRRDTQTNNSL